MTDNVVYTNETSLFTLKGSIAVHFMDGEILAGVYATQDAFNIFITVNDEPVMIPRQQIRYIKGLAGQGIEPDTGPDAPTDDAPTQVPLSSAAQIVATQPLPDAPDITASPTSGLMPPPLPPQADDDDDGGEDGTMILPPGHDDAVYDIGGDDEGEEEEDGTMILSLDEELGASALDTPFDTSESLLKVKPPAPVQEEEEEAFDMTVVLGDSAQPDEFAEDDKTMALGPDVEKELDAALVCINGPHIGEVYQLTAGITTVGRSSDNVIVLFKDKEISRHHAIVLFESDRYVVQDQNSLNGTFVNDEQISGPRYLENGDVVMVGVSYLKYEVS